jgi:hypothetical protein
MKPVLNKIIHTDQKGFVAGRNISENNRMIDDIIEFVNNFHFIYNFFPNVISVYIISVKNT